MLAGASSLGRISSSPIPKSSQYHGQNPGQANRDENLDQQDPAAETNKAIYAGILVKSIDMPVDFNPVKIPNIINTIFRSYGSE
jgi:hypothetical protein